MNFKASVLLLMSLVSATAWCGLGDTYKETRSDGTKVEYRMDNSGHKFVLLETSPSGQRTYTTWDNNSQSGTGPDARSTLCQGLVEGGKRRISYDPDALFVGFTECHCELLYQTQTRCHVGTQARSKQEISRRP